MKLYELMAVNAEWKWNTVLSIQTVKGIIKIRCLDMCESEIFISGKHITCLNVKWFSGNNIIAW